MAYVRLSSLIIFFLHLCLIDAQASLPLLKTKQPVENIKYISNDGKFTYYINRKGELLLANDYNIEVVMEGKEDTQYNIFEGEGRKYLLIERDENYFNYLALRKSRKLYIVPFGGKEAKAIGEGICPSLQNKDQYVSFYDVPNQEIKFFNIALNKVDLSLSLVNKKNSYSCPQVAMISAAKILFTDLNEKGLPGLLEYDSLKNKKSTVYKSDTENVRIELCKYGEVILLGVFPLHQFKHPSQIFPIVQKEGGFMPDNPLIENSTPIIGNMICSHPGELYYIGTNGPYVSEIMRFDIKEKKEAVLSDLKYISQIVDMDGRLLAPYRGNIYVIKGASDVYRDIPLDEKK
jgi:hypothetical protein